MAPVKNVLLTLPHRLGDTEHRPEVSSDDRAGVTAAEASRGM